MKSMPLVNEAENNPTECQIHKVVRQANHSGKKEAALLNYVLYPQTHSAKGSSDQSKTGSTKTNWKGSHSSNNIFSML